MPAALLCARFTDQELALRKQARTGVRPLLPNPATTAWALALAICEVEAGLRSASQLERICHPSLWAAVADRIQRGRRSTGQRHQRPPCPGPRAHAGTGGCGRGPASGPAARVHRLAAGGGTGLLGAHRTPLLIPTPATTDRRGEPTHRLAGYPQPTARGLAPVGAGRYRPSHGIRPAASTGPGRLAGPAAGRASHDLRRGGVRRRPGRGPPGLAGAGRPGCPRPGL